MIVKQISSDEAICVRYPVLRKGKPIDSCKFDGDDLPTTFHLGVYIERKLVGVVTVLEKKDALFDNENQFQIRGMAVLHDFQRKGLGVLLIESVENRIINLQGNFIWLNAREVAVNFYSKLGYQIIGKEFNIPKIGLHYTMIKYL